SVDRGRCPGGDADEAAAAVQPQDKEGYVGPPADHGAADVLNRLTYPTRGGTIHGVTPEQCAAAAKRPVRDVGTAWSTCAAAVRGARALGLAGWVFSVAGGGGALGADVRPDTVAAALGLIAPEAVRGGWEGARAIGPVNVARERLGQCCRWGRERL